MLSSNIQAQDVMRNLFEETKIKGITLKNRFVRSSTWESMATPEGYLTDQLMDVYKELAKGDVGLILTGYAFVTKEEQPSPRMMGIYDDSFIKDFRALTDMVHHYGSRIVLQIVYGGTQTRYRPEDRVIWGPSAVKEIGSGVVAKEMTLKEIRTLIKSFGDSALRTKSAGFDGVQIHCAHGYLLGQFLSPYHNRRADKYGGSIQNRARIIIEIYEEIRNQVGRDFPVLIKINAEDFVENGATFDDCRFVCKELSKRGIDAIEVSGGILAAAEEDRPSRPMINSSQKEGYFAPYAAKIAEENDVPIILVGGLRSPQVIERLLETTQISYFSMARPFLTEPDLVQRWHKGDLRRAKCVSCNRCREGEGNMCIFHRKSKEQ